jgi:hypothetical protein
VAGGAQAARRPIRLIRHPGSRASSELAEAEDARTQLNLPGIKGTQAVSAISKH